MMYLPTFGRFLMVNYGFHVGKYTSPMDPMGTPVVLWEIST